MILKIKKFVPKKRYCKRCNGEMDFYSDERWNNICNKCWEEIHIFMYRNYTEA